MRPFKSEKVLEEKISDATFRAYHVGYDQNRFRLRPLVDVIRRVIPEFALGYYDGLVPLTEVVEKVQEAANLVYTTETYRTRGEFGELILHLLLRDFMNTIPLVSKIRFKDARNATVHGFDAVQVTSGQLKKLWLGESKLYKNGSDGVADLVNDLREHLKADYLRSEFDLISRKLPEEFPEIEHWRSLMDKHTRLDEIYDNIVIPLVCTYSSETVRSYTDETDEYFTQFLQECRALKEQFDRTSIHTNIEVLLMLLPVEDKNELNAELDARLKSMQAI